MAEPEQRRSWAFGYSLLIVQDIHSITWAEIRCVLFDLDGVIVNSEPLHFKAWRETLLKFHGGNLTWDKFLKDYYGRADTESVAKLPPPLYQQQKEILLFKNKVFCDHLTEIPIAHEVVQFIKASLPKLPCGLVSNALKVEVDMLLASLGLKKSFEVVVTVNDVRHPKPAPDPYALAFKTINRRLKSLVLEQVLVIEDSEIGVNSALAAGMGLVLHREFQHPDVMAVLQKLQARSMRSTK